MLLDGKGVASIPSGLRVPASHKGVSFRLGKAPGAGGETGHRLRFKLDGVDNDWRQMTSEMCVMVRFVDAAGDQVGQQIFQVTGRSPGWTGSIENSSFTHRLEAVRVPAGSATLTAAITSSGPPTAIGVYVVETLTVLRPGANGPQTVLEAATESSDRIPQGWNRSGTRPSMARMVQAGEAAAFCIVDDDPNAHAEWNLTRAAAVPVHPGEELTVKWSEMYDIGMSNRFDVNYGTLDAGTYRFLANELDAFGNPLKGTRSIEFVVLQPFWKSVWFWIVATVGAGSFLWWACRAIIRARIRHHLARVEQERVVERERLRIARDLHDDLGARLTHISLVSGLAENDQQSPAARDSFRQISGMARDLVAALYQTVWSVNPENDDLESLINFVGQLTQTLCEAAGIRFRIHSCATPRDYRVTSEIRHNLTLAVKEAIHNAIKHAGATEIITRAEFANSHLTITVSDNGRGFDPAAIDPGCGLANMQRRMEMIEGKIGMESTPGTGTRIRFEVLIPSPSQTAPERQTYLDR